MDKDPFFPVPPEEAEPGPVQPPLRSEPRTQPPTPPMVETSTPPAPPVPPEKPPAGKSGQAGFPIFGSLQTIIGVALVMATLFTLWTPANLFSNQMLEQMMLAWQTQANATPVAEAFTPTPPAKPTIGIVSGHWKHDSGTVCADGLTEESVNLRIATLVKQKLSADGYNVDLLEEFDPRLSQYKSLALVSIHNDSCQYINDEATGFKVAAALHSSYPEKTNRLMACMVDRYARDTGLRYHANSITPDMTEYHAFDEIHSDTTAIIIETGFLNLDRQILTEQTDTVATGVEDGILCYIHNEQVKPLNSTP